MDFWHDYWPLIITAIVVVMAALVWVIEFQKKPREERLRLIREWLLQAVILIEKEYGSGTGKLKLSVAYDRFCERFPWLVKVVPFEVFAQLVDDALAQMKEILSNNRAIANIVEGSDSTGFFSGGAGHERDA